MVWQVEITADQFDLDEVARAAPQFACRVISSEGRQFLQCDSFEARSDVAGVRDEASSKLSILNGWTKLHHPDHRSVQLGSVTQQVNPDGTKSIALSIEGIGLRLRGGAATLTVRRADGSVEVDAESQSNLAQLVVENSQLAELISVLSEQTSWQKLRVVFERISELVGGGDNALVKNGYASQAEITKFKANVQDPRLSGVNAVHGVASGPIKGTKMSEQEGLTFLTRIIKRYLVDRSQKK